MDKWIIGFMGKNSLEKKRDEGTWVTRASDDMEKFHPKEDPLIHQSDNPPIR
jgi:hypothetical protein